MAFLAQIQQAQLAGSDRLRGICEQAATRIIEDFRKECLAAARRSGKKCTSSNVLERMNAIDALDQDEKRTVFLDTLRTHARKAFGDTVSIVITVITDRVTDHRRESWRYGQDAAPGLAWTDMRPCEKIELSLTFPEPSAKLPQAAEARSSLNGPCAICLEVVPVVALVPCGHCVCVGCQGKLPQGQGCPVCRGAVAGHQNLFGA